MSKKGAVESFQVKITRNDRFAQMSHQEKVIEQKKKEIQARLEQKQKGATNTTSDNGKSNVSSTSKQNKSSSKPQEAKKCPSSYNVFSNDGSFLDQFKQMKEKKMDQKLKSFKSRETQDHSNSEDRSIHKNSRWSQKRRSPSPKERSSKLRVSRFSDKPPNFEPKININVTYSSLLSQPNFDVQPQTSSVSAQNVTGQPLLKNLIPPPGVAYPTPAQSTAPVIAAPPLLLNVPPPQVLQTQLVVPPPPSIPNNSVLVSAGNVISLPPPNVLNTVSNQQVSVPVSTQNTIGVPPPCVPTIELSSIPPPNPIQVHNIPQPEPINALTIPPPAPIQVQNIPPPSPIHLNEIPNPKPLDLMNIPTPNETNCVEKSISDPDFIKNIPPPNKSVPPPSLPEVSLDMSVPPPPNVTAVTAQSPIPTCLPPPNILPSTSIPPPQPTQQTIQHPQNILVHSIPPPQLLHQPQPGLQNLPPPPPPQSALAQSISIALPIQGQLPVGVVPPPPVSVSNAIPSLMAQPILPPPGMGLAPPPPINLNCPPPLIPGTSVTTALQGLPPSFVNQPPPITSQMPPMNIPPPTTALPVATSLNTTFKDLNAVFPPGSPDYEAMASLGRMVAQCGPGIEDIVRQRKLQDPSLWFLFHKESAAYRQYLQLIEEFKAKMSKPEVKEENYKPEDIYEPEMATEEDCDGVIKQEVKTENQESTTESGGNKKKRKSRWGEKDTSVPPPSLNIGAIATVPLSVSYPSGQVLLSKVTRNDPALIQYAVSTYGSTNLTEEEWKKAEEHFKINLLYQDMLRKKQEVEKLQMAGKNKYEYDSDEETEGGTWEHKLREKEMISTQLWAEELTKQAEGKHHIGDYLPPEELQKFIDKTTGKKDGTPENMSDYKEFKLKEDNIGFKMLQKLGWSEGQGLGSKGSGIVEPVNKAGSHDQNQGLGLNQSNSTDDDEYDAYRKRMMLAYRFRPNPLNNPRRPYY